MEKIKNNIVNVIYLFIIASPILDNVTYLMREIMQLNVSFSTILKPLIMGLIYLFFIAYLFFVKKQKPIYLIPMFIVVIYAGVHILITKNAFFSFSYSTFSEEVKRMIQIIYVMLVICNFVILYRNKEDFNFHSDQLIKVLAISGMIYYVFYFASLITGTSALSYSNDTNLGYQGWLVPSHLINHIGSLLIPLVWLQYKKEKNKIWLGMFTLMCILCFGFIGTKSGTFSIYIILALLILFELIRAVFSFEKKILYILSFLVIFLCGTIFAYRYTYTYQNIYVMRNDLEQSEGMLSEKVTNIIDSVEGGSSVNIADPARMKYYKTVEKSLVNLEKVTYENGLAGADNRTNELIYNSYLFRNLGWKHQIFGVGFCNQPNHLYMENDVYSMLFNYGIIPFVLVYLPFLLIFAFVLIKIFIQFVKAKLQFFEEEYMLLIAMSLFIFLTYTTGYLLIQTSLIILYVPIFIHCFDALNKKIGTVNLKNRIRKYLSIVSRMKNRGHYRKELSKRDALSVFDYMELSQDMPVAHYELSKDNTLYGIAHCLRSYAGYHGLLDSYIEHGVNFSTSVYPPDAVNGLSNIIAVSKRRIDIINQNYTKHVYPVGPYIHYADPLYGQAQFDQDKKVLGKVLLIFPSKSIEGVNHTFDSDEFIAEIKKVKEKVGADTVLVNIYFYDIQQGMHKRFAAEGFQIVTAGHKNDIHFTNRLKYIISLADYTMSNNIGTHIGYCLYMKKPHYVFRQKVEISGENAQEEFYEERLRTYNESQKQILDAFSAFSFEITEKQLEIYREHWDPKSIKSKEQLFDILKDSEYRKDEKSKCNCTGI